MKIRLALIPGDGIGPDIVKEAVRVLDMNARRKATQSFSAP